MNCYQWELSASARTRMLVLKRDCPVASQELSIDLSYNKGDYSRNARPQIRAIIWAEASILGNKKELHPNEDSCGSTN